MKIRIIVAGKPALPYARGGVEEYLKRLPHGARPELVHVKAGGSDETSKRLIEASRGCHRIALDERGEAPTTRQLAESLAGLDARGDIKTVAFLIGAADGHNDALRAACDRLLALSPLTLQHELALLVLLEQLYRVHAIRSGSPYHRDGATGSTGDGRVC